MAATKQRTTKSTKTTRKPVVPFVPVINPVGKTINYDRTTGDFSLYLDGEYVGSSPSYFDGETRLNQLVYDRLTKGIVPAEADEPATNTSSDADEAPAA
ncbi:hypothetical protein [Herpetosiphon llansteffanensis]|uniref:hypothetical protein n=1 Tax=Herpetosiphon llansteffanensis TaxID=2094568 RepID=UPI000D7C1475|nr:hypothetical protein [Herpetosiphon llansteffanensis]